jgi:SAM-dependent methyltransferase
MNNSDKYNELLKKSGFFNKTKTVEVFTGLSSDNKVIISTDKLVKLNIASGPNIFPFDGWINYDKIDSTDYFKYLDWQNKEKTEAYVLYLMPEHQQILANYIRSGGKIDFRVQDISSGFSHHNDNTVDLIYLGQMIEHLNPIYETSNFLKDCYRMMKPGGVIRITTPDLNVLIQAYISGEMNKFADEQPEFYKTADASSQLAFLMYGASGPNCTQTNYEGHMFLFTQKSMTDMLKSVGFKDIEFYYETGKSKSEIMAKEVVDAGMSHSFICEAVK